MARLGIEIDVHAQVVGTPAQLLQRIHHFDPGLQRIPRGHIRIVSDDVKTERFRLAGYGAPDIAQADDAEYLTGDMTHRAQVLARPHAAPNELVMQHELPRADEEMHHGVV